MVEGLGSGQGLWEVSALRASVRVQRFICLLTLFLVLSVIASGLVNHETVGVGRPETGKVQANMVSSSFPLLFRSCVELDFHNKVLKFVRCAHWDLKSYAFSAP